MDLSTTYLGLHLPHPLIMGASPLVDDLDMVRRIEDAGAAAIVMHSLFEEQITLESVGHHRHYDAHGDSNAEALSYHAVPQGFGLGPDEYLEQIRKIKEIVDVPVIGSLNGATDEGWLDYAKLIEQAGADALELNVYALVTDPDRTAAAVEAGTIAMLKHVKSDTKLPVALKLSPFYSALAHFARELCHAGADGLVLFNRLYQPDIDIEQLEVQPRLELSNSAELLLRLHWLAILSPLVSASLAVTGGVHSASDALKATMAGAHGIQMVSTVLKHGPERIGQIRQEMEHWLDEHEYDGLAQARGSMNLAHTPDPAAYERTNYMRVLQSYTDRL